VESVVSAGQVRAVSRTAVASADDAPARDAEEEDFVDVVGDDETGAAPVDDSLERDLQMTPENSGDERDTRLSSSGSDSETSDFRFAGDGVPTDIDQSAVAEVMTYEYDENAQDYVGYVDIDDAVVGEFEPGAEAAAAYDDDDAEHSFDPQAFFSSFAQNALGTEQQSSTPAAGDDINTDLQMSDSDDSEAGLVAVDDDDDASNQDFDMAEFLKQT